MRSDPSVVSDKVVQVQVLLGETCRRGNDLPHTAKFMVAAVFASRGAPPHPRQKKKKHV